MSDAVNATEWDLLVNGRSQQDSGNSLFESATKGDFAYVLRSSVAAQLLTPFAKEIAKSSNQSNSIALNKIQIDKSIVEANPLDSLFIAVAALHAFVQVNWTGPDLEQELLHPIQLLRRISPDSFPARSINEDSNDDVLESILKSASLESLTWSGEPAYHLSQSPFLLLFALKLFNSLPDSIQSKPLWRLRAYAIHSRILDSPVAVPDDVMESIVRLKEFLTAKRDSALAEDKANSIQWGKILAKTLTDEGLMLQRVGKDREANERFLEAANSNGLQYEITGAPGRRTKFQKEDKMILILLARSSNYVESGNQEAKAGDVVTDQDEAEEMYDADPREINKTPAGWKVTENTDRFTNMPSEMLHNDDTLLERTRFTTNQGGQSSEKSSNFNESDIANPSILDPLDSCILLGMCLNIHNASPENGLTASQMSAFVQRCLTHARNWSVHTMGLLLRSRLEADRTRTVQRSTLQLQALLDQMPTSDSSLFERLELFHELDLPSKWEMQAELARRYAALGVLRSALEIFERIELWQEVVQCWGALGRQDKGIEVIRDLLQGQKAESDHVISAQKNRSEHVQIQLNAARQAKLWCLLGDLEVDKAIEHYMQAWNVSQNRSARAARSLGAMYFSNGDSAKSTIWLRKSLKIQPLYARTWFTLGCVYLRLDSIEGYIEAARCFRRCTALDDEDAESWNNLASCYLRLSQQSEGVLREARLAEHADAVTDQRAVLAGIEEEEDEDGQSSSGQSDIDSLHSRDSGVAVESDTESEAETEIGENDQSDEERLRRQMQRSTLTAINGGGSGQGAFDVKLLAHRALGKALKYAHDDWRVWNNYMIVSVDCGLMGDAVRSLVRVVELRAGARTMPGSGPAEMGSKVSSILEEAIDIAVLNRIVEAVIRAPSSIHEAVAEQEESPSNNGSVQVSTGAAAKKVYHNPNEGHGLWPSVRNLFEDTLLPRVSDLPDIWRAYARLLFWRGRLRSALEAHLSAWRASYGAESCDLTQQSTFIQAVEALIELSELLENFGHREIAIDEETGLDLDIDSAKLNPSAKREIVMNNWQFRARSLVRTFMGKTRDAFDSDPNWEKLEELRDSLSPNKS